MTGVDPSQLDGDIATVTVSLLFHRLVVDLTIVVMVISEVCARIKRPASSVIAHPVSVCSVGFVANNIPFFSLNFSIVLGILANLVLNKIVYINEATGVQF